ncbi:MAG TPA: hypothetical protein PKV98_15010 [Burkholderiaceae bacterium]|nr:hypothetical protein [Burkholderiaceae bacterium]
MRARSLPRAEAIALVLRRDIERENLALRAEIAAAAARESRLRCRQSWLEARVQSLEVLLQAKAGADQGAGVEAAAT